MGEASLSELLLEIRLLDSNFKKALGASSEAMEKFEKTIEHVEETSKRFKALAVAGLVFSGMGFGVMEALKGMLEPAIEFAKVQDELQLATGASSEELREFAERAHDLSRTLPVSAEAITVAEAQLAKTLGSTQAALEGIEVATKFAAATHMQAAQAAQLLGEAYQSLGNRSLGLHEGLEDVANLLTTLKNRFPGAAGNGEMFARSLAHAAAAASTLNVQREQLAAFIGVSSQMGLGGRGGAGQVVEGLIETLTKVDKRMRPIIEHFGARIALNPQGGVDLLGTLQNINHLPFNNLKALELSLGTEGASIQQYLNHINELEEAQRSLHDVTGATEKTAEAMANTPAGRLQIFANNVDLLKESIGTSLLPALIKVTRAMTPLLQVAAAFAEAHPTIIAVIASIAALGAGVLLTIGPMLMMIATFREIAEVFQIVKWGAWALRTAVTALAVTFEGAWMAEAVAGLKSMRTAMIAFDIATAANPIGLIVAGAAALAAIGYEVYEHWDKVRQVFKDIAAIVPPWLRGAPEQKGVPGGGTGTRPMNPITASAITTLGGPWLAMLGTLNMFGASAAPAAPVLNTLQGINNRVPASLTQTIKLADLMPRFEFPSVENSPAISPGIGSRGTGSFGDMNIGDIHLHLTLEGSSDGSSGTDLANSILSAMQDRRQDFSREIVSLMDDANRRANTKGGSR